MLLLLLLLRILWSEEPPWIWIWKLIEINILVKCEVQSLVSTFYWSHGMSPYILQYSSLYKRKIILVFQMCYILLVFLIPTFSGETTIQQEWKLFCIVGIIRTILNWESPLGASKVGNSYFLRSFPQQNHWIDVTPQLDIIQKQWTFLRLVLLMPSVSNW